MAEPKSELLPILILDDLVILPNMTLTGAVDGVEQIAALKAAREGNHLILIVPRVGERISSVGTVGRLIDVGTLREGVEIFVVRGEYRAKAEAGQILDGALWVPTEPFPDPPEPTAATIKLADTYRALMENLFETRGIADAVKFLHGARAPAKLADLAGYSPDLTTEQKVEVLETIDIDLRLAKLIEWTTATLQEATVKEQVRTEVVEGMEKAQREFFLRNQRDAINKQLGESGGELENKYREKLAAGGLPEGAAKEVEREIDRLARMSEQNPEHGWIRTYLDWMFDIPWNVRSEDNFDLKEARRVLDEDHTGLDDVKERIIEFLAVRKLRSERGLETLSGRGAGAIITLVGPPGSGKTSLGQSVARALGRKFTRLSLGGIHDESDIRGHRRTYIGSMPGRIVRALKEAGTKNPVIMLDEIDKVGSDWRGDPSSALLEVLDPAQNSTFRDHYLDVDLDLSEVLFITTANVSDTIPAPLLDRMELIRLDGYTELEKVAIARDHLLPRQVSQAGLTPEELVVTDKALLAIIGGYTREAGVRNLERNLGKVARKVAMQIADGSATAPVTVEPESVATYLRRAKFDNEVERRTAVAGVATGLAVTGVGGEVLFIEAALMGGKDGLLLTGQLGDVMKESAQTALSFVRSHAKALGIEEDELRGTFHIHVPAGAIPKDGPSAGVAMVTALVSLLTGQLVKSTVGMTGEVSLKGLVMPIGGLKQKVLAAHRMGLTEVILPKRNENELEDIPESVAKEMTFHAVSRVEEVLDLALEGVRPERRQKSPEAGSPSKAPGQDVGIPISDKHRYPEGTTIQEALYASRD